MVEISLTLSGAFWSSPTPDWPCAVALLRMLVIQQQKTNGLSRTVGHGGVRRLRPQTQELVIPSSHGVGRIRLSLDHPHLDGGQVWASGGLQITPDASMHKAPPMDTIIVCGGVGIQRTVTREQVSWLQSQARKAQPIASPSCDET